MTHADSTARCDCGECKPCRDRARAKAFREAHPDEQRARNRASYARHAETKKAKQRAWNATHEAAVARRARNASPETIRKRPARQAVYRALRDGKMTRPTSCPACGNTGRIEAHHHNGYDQAHWLDVIWLCSACHAMTDRAR